jgi:Tol biopolymer transport system component
VFGQPVTFNATVATVTSGIGTPTGTVQFKVDGVSLGGPVTLVAGSSTSPTLTTTVGVHAVTAVYSGDSSYLVSTSPALSQTVNKSATTIALNLSANPSMYGQPVTASAAVASVAPGTGSPSGDVQFKVDGANLGGPITLVGGSATSPAIIAGAGVHAITALYGGDPSFAGSASASAALTITPAPLTVTANDATRYFGQQNPTFTTTVSGLVNGDSASTLGVPVFATAAIRTSPVGAYPITVSGLANTNYTFNYVAGALHVDQAPTVTTLTSSPNPSFANMSVVLTATVASSAPAGLNPSGTGSVSFMRGATTLATVPLDNSGQASATITALPVGHDTLTAVYSGDANYLSSTSSAITQVVKANLIVFSSNRDGNFEIYSMDMSTGVQTRLTNNPAVDTMPAYSPNGSRIAFVSSRGGLAQIWLMNADGTNLKQLTTDPGVSGTPAWSPDGTKLVYTSTRSGSVQLWVVGAGGPYPATSPLQLTPNSFAAADTTPAWSPNGQKILFTSTHSGWPQIWMMNADGTSPTRVSNDSAIDITPAWSPDGTLIAFSSTQQGLPAIFLMDSSGGNVMRLTNNASSIDATPSWAPDGSMITFTSALGGTVEIYQIKATGGGQATITTGPAVNALPQWCCTAAP